MSLTPYDILRRHWGYHAFRPLQEEIIDHVLTGADTIALLPTGGGKSICFQVPALAQEGLTLVISPLIALMNDQVNQLKTRGIRAASVHSGMHRQEVIRLLDAAEFGNLKLLYISPERLQQREFSQRLLSLPLSLLVIDEAHCISMWGYDFRPAYLTIANVRKTFPKVPIIALTASATKEVIEDIAKKLELKEPQIFRSEFLRPNLRFGVLKAADKKQKIWSLLKNVNGASIVYVRSRRQAREVANVLSDRGLTATYYHAGLSRDERLKREQQFFKKDCKIMVATNAFGMGIDKADIRMVIHHDLPDSLEAYYQEAGRAGRDGKDAYAIILYHEGDRRRLERQFEASFPPMDEVKRVYRALGNYLKLALGSGEGHSFPFDFQDFAKEYRFDISVTWNVLRLLEQAGWLILSDTGRQPAKVGFRANKELAYDYQLRNKAKDPIIRGLQRLYQGILQESVPIKENQLCNLLQMNLGGLRKSLLELQQDGIIYYQPQEDRPRLIMLRERVAHENLTIDQDLFKFRKEKRRAALREMMDYLTIETCRQEFILSYFDDEISMICGICDNCRAGKRQHVDDYDFHRLRTDLLALLTAGEKPLAAVIDHFPGDSRQALLRVMQYLLNEEQITKSDEMISVN